MSNFWPEPRMLNIWPAPLSADIQRGMIFLNNRKYEHLGADLLSDIKRGEILLRCCVNQQAWLKYLPENVLWHSVHDILIVSLSVFS